MSLNRAIFALTSLSIFFLSSRCRQSQPEMLRALSSKNAIVIGWGSEPAAPLADSLLGDLFPTWRTDRGLLTDLGLTGEHALLTGLQYIQQQGWLPTFIAPWAGQLTLTEQFPDLSWREYSIFRGVPVYQWRDDLFAATTRGLLIVGRMPLLVEDAIRELDGGKANLGADRSIRRQWVKQTGGGRRLFLRPGEFSSLWQGPPWLTFWLGDYEWVDIFVQAGDGQWSIEGAALPKRVPLQAPRAQGREPGWLPPFLPDNITLLHWTNIPVSALPDPYRTYFQPWWEGQIIVFQLEGQPHSVFALRAAAAERAQTGMLALADRQGILSEERYQLFQVRQLLDEQLLEQWRPAGSRNPYYAIAGDFVLFSSSRSALTVCLDYFVAGRPPAIPSMLPEIFDPAAIRLCWLRPDVLFDAASPVTELAWVELPASRQVRIQGRARRAEAADRNFSLWWKYPLNADIVAGPAAIGDEGGRLLALMVQDEGNRLYCLDGEGRLLWSKSLGDRIAGGFHTLHGRDQTLVFFNTVHQVYALDLTGAFPAPFPLNLPAPAAAGLQLVDFDRTGRAAIFVPTVDAAVYGFDQEGVLLPGWNPLRDALPLRFPLMHLQENYRDVLLGVNRADSVLIWNRAGEQILPGRRIDAPCLSPPQLSQQPPQRILFVDAGGRGSALSGAGVWTTFSFPGGKRSSVRWRYANIRDDEREEYLLHSGRELSAFSEQGGSVRELFHYEFSFAPDTVFVIAEGPADESLIGALNVGRKQLQMLDGNGRLLAGTFVAADQPAVLISKTGDRFAVATGLGRDVMVYGKKY